ncbi:MAG: hypothetical protein MK033_09150 [Candidatus Caenarcaniphilales bacterium]|nr:hypothetical protein [Candidatus Caenarcaniphilales bacterium]
MFIAAANPGLLKTMPELKKKFKDGVIDRRNVVQGNGVKPPPDQTFVVELDMSFKAKSLAKALTGAEEGTELDRTVKTDLIRTTIDNIKNNTELKNALDQLTENNSDKAIESLSKDMINGPVSEIAEDLGQNQVTFYHRIKTEEAMKDMEKGQAQELWTQMKGQKIVSGTVFSALFTEADNAINSVLNANQGEGFMENVSLLDSQINLDYYLEGRNSRNQPKNNNSTNQANNNASNSQAFNGKKLLMFGLPIVGSAMLGLGLADPFGVHNIKGNPIDLTPASPSLVEGSSNEILDKISSFKSNQNPDKSDISNITNELFLQNSETQLMKVIAKGKQDIVENKDGSHTAVLKISNPYQDSEYVADVTLFTNDDPSIFEKYILVVPREVSGSNPIYYIGNDGTFEKFETEIPGLDKILK